MPQIRFESRKVDHEQLLRFISGLFQAAGMPPLHAALVAESLVESNLRGIDSHGVARVPHYLTRLGLGSLNLTPDIRVVSLGASAARVEGDRGMGQLVMSRAAEEAIHLARQTGAGWVTVSDSSHCGALSYFGLQIAEAGLIGLVFTHVGSLVLPSGSRDPFCGTNPICLTAPRAPSGANEWETGAVCLDMSTSIIPWNTVMNARQEGVPLEPGWAVDAEGQPTTDAQAVAALYAIGGPKGSGLGLMIDVFCSLLADVAYGPDINKMYEDLTKPRRLGGLVGAISIEQFVPIERFHQRLMELTRRWGELRPAEGTERVLFPGEPELLHRRQRLAEGIPLGLNLLDEFAKLADRYAVEPLG